MSGTLPPVAILAGGLATRLRPLTETIPKALLPVAGEPFVAHQLRLLRNRGVSKVVMCVGHLGDRIREFLQGREDFGLEVEYSFDGPVLRGTAGAIRHALPILGEQFFVLYGDSYLPCDYLDVTTAFRASGKSGLMTVFRNQGRWDASNVEFTGGEILAYDKSVRTSRMQHIDYGLGMFRASAFSSASERDLAAVYQSLLARGELAGMEVQQRFYEIGSAEGLEELSSLLGAHGVL
jgi:NDP-sugar pyrophosphorylase family protein